MMKYHLFNLAMTETMKKLFLYLLMIVAAVVSGCTEDLTSDDEININNVKSDFMQVEAALEAPAEARTTLTDDGSGKVLWSEGDTIGAVSADGVVTECAIESVNGSTALFSVPTDTKYAIYPYSSTTTYNAENGTLTHTLPSAITLDGSKRVFNDKENVMVAELASNKLPFRHLCGFIEVKLSGSQTVTGVTLRNNLMPWHPISGTGVIDLSDASNPKFTGDPNHGKGFHWVDASCKNITLSQAEPTSFYFILPAGEYDKLAITIKTTTGSYSVQSSAAITVNRAKIRPLATINVDQLALTSVTDLSEGGLANCYIVEQGSAAKNYSFTARKINGTENIANVAYAHLTWAESKDLIGSVNYDTATGKVSFTYKGGNVEGNASIAVFSAAGAQLWTWHIWCTDKPELLKVCKVNATQIYGIQDRNLGATYTPKTVSEATGISEKDATASIGLYYQYGRPTPYPRVRSIKTTSEATAFSKSTTTCDVMYGFRAWNQDFRGTTTKQTYATALQYPNLFYSIYYTDKTGATYSSSATGFHTWYHQIPPYGAFANKDYLWQSANANVVTAKSDNCPCPPGYVVDEGIAGLGYINTTYSRVNWGTGVAESYGYYYNCPVTNAVVWMASSGYRNTGGKFSYVGRNFNLWMVPTYADNGALMAYRFYPGDTNATTQLTYKNYSALSQGFNVRCRVMDRTDLQGLVFGEAFSEGDGTEASPYILKTATDVARFAGLVSGTMQSDSGGDIDYSKAHFALGASINMNGVGINPITNFSGSLDGRGNAISNLTLTTTTNAPVGLFVRTDGAIIKNLTLTNVAVNSAYMMAAGLVGEAKNTTIENCSVSGNVASTASATYKPGNGLSNGASGVAAGVVAVAFDSTIKDVTFTGNVNAKGQFAAGIVAHIDGGKIENAKVAGGQIYSESNHVGGIAARACGNTEIIGCVVESQVVSKTGVVGGIAGRVYGATIKNSLVSSKGAVTSHYLNPTSTSYFGVGGIVGSIETSATYGTQITIDGCANYAPITGNFYCGGLVGLAKTSATTVPITIKNSLFFGGIKVAYKSNGHAFSGGLVGAVNTSGSTDYALFELANCAAVISEFEYDGTSTGPCIGGIVGLTYYKFAATNCYSNLEGSDIVDASGNPITSTSLVQYGAVYGYANGSTSGVTFADCYYSSAVKVGCDASTTDAVNVEKCYTVTAQEITDGTLLAKLNTTVPAGAVSWVAGADGYPIPSGLLANTGVTTSSAKVRVSVIGDSISTFVTHIPAGYTTFYPKGTVVSAGQTYWYKLIYNYMKNAKLDMNIAWSGTLVTRCTNESYASQHWYGHDFVARFIDKGMGNPDVILINGGTNDCSNRGEVSLYPNYAIDGSACPTDEEMATVFSAADAATTRAALEALPDDYFVHAYVKLLSLMHEQYPNAKVVMLIGHKIKSGAKAAMLKIANHYGSRYGYKCVDLNETTFSGVDGTHPDEVGHENIAKLIYTKVGSYIE